MYRWSHKSSVKDGKSRKNTPPPSFSSTLLDEIYRSMDGDDEKCGGGGGGDGQKVSTAVEDEGVALASLRRAFLVEKWMDMKNVKILNRRTRRQSLPEFELKTALDNDPIFFSSGTSSSDSSINGWFSDIEGFHDSKFLKPSCFRPSRKPEPVKTKSFSKKNQQMEIYYCSDYHQTNGIDHGALIKSKARALKIYANLKKIKQPISPGGRLTTFLNSLFTNGHVKKPNKYSNPPCFDQKKIETTSKCSSASSFTRSCLSKDSPRSREKKLKNGVRRSVRFYPVSVIIDQDSRPCGRKLIIDKQDFTKDDDYNAEDDDDAKSDSSSDLFELDDLSVLKECEELPVYETTNFGTNRAIANGLIC